MRNRTFGATRRACYAGYIVQAVINNLPSLLFVIFRQELGLSEFQLGTTILINFLTQLAVDALSVPLSAWLGYRGVMAGSHLMAALGLVLLGILPRTLPNGFVGVIIPTMIYAVGSGMIEALVSPIVDYLPEEGREGGKAAGMALLHSFYCWGSVLTVVVSTVALKLVGAAWYWVPISWALFPLCNLYNMLTVPLPQMPASGKEPVGDLLKNVEFWMLLGCMVCSGASEISIAQWMSYFTEQSLELPKMAGDLLGPCLFAVMMGIGRTFYGLFGHRWPLQKVLVGTAALCVGGYLLTALSGNAVLSLIGCLVCGIGVSLMWPGTISNASSRITGCAAMYAFLAMGGDTGCSTGPFLTGWVADATGSLPTGILAATVFPAAMLILTLALMLKKKKVK